MVAETEWKQWRRWQLMTGEHEGGWSMEGNPQSTPVHHTCGPLQVCSRGCAYGLAQCLHSLRFNHCDIETLCESIGATTAANLEGATRVMHGCGLWIPSHTRTTTIFIKFWWRFFITFLNDLKYFALNAFHRCACTYVYVVEGDHRIVRTCATGGRPHDGCVARTGTSRIKLWYCECLGDECNTAPPPPSLTNSPLLLLLLILTTYISRLEV